jgi:transposase
LATGEPPLSHPRHLHRKHGVRHYLSAYDVHADRLVMRCYRRKRWREFLSFLKIIRRRFPANVRLCVVLDNFSPHKKKEVLDWAEASNVSLTFTPTNASWLNRIEPLFAGVRYFTLNNSDHADHGEIEKAIKAYVTWRNRRPDHAKLRRLEKHKLCFGSRH